MNPFSQLGFFTFAYQTGSNKFRIKNGLIH